jgi:hypothetical protein
VSSGSNMAGPAGQRLAPGFEDRVGHLFATICLTI